MSEKSETTANDSERQDWRPAFPRAEEVNPLMVGELVRVMGVDWIDGDRIYRPDRCECCARGLFLGGHVHESDGTRG